MNWWKRLFGGGGEPKSAIASTLQEPVKPEPSPRRATVCEPPGQISTASQGTTRPRVDIAREYRNSSEIFAMLDGAPVRCPATGTDKEKLMVLIGEHEKRLAEGPPSHLLFSGKTALLKTATERELQHIQHLVELVQTLG